MRSRGSVERERRHERAPLAKTRLQRRSLCCSKTIDITVASWKHDAPEIIRIDQNFANKLAALKPPNSIAAAVADYRKASDKSFQDDKNAVAAAKAGDAAKLRAAITQGNKDNNATFPSAKAIGARGCYF